MLRRKKIFEKSYRYVFKGVESDYNHEKWVSAVFHTFFKGPDPWNFSQGFLKNLCTITNFSQVLKAFI